MSNDANLLKVLREVQSVNNKVEVLGTNIEALDDTIKRMRKESQVATEEQAKHVQQFKVYAQLEANRLKDEMTADIFQLTRPPYTACLSEISEVRSNIAMLYKREYAPCRCHLMLPMQPRAVPVPDTPKPTAPPPKVIHTADPAEPTRPPEIVEDSSRVSGDSSHTFGQ